MTPNMRFWRLLFVPPALALDTEYNTNAIVVDICVSTP